MEPRKFEISDDSGFLGIVNADTYKSFVDEDWELLQLFDHFVDEMNADALIIWSTGTPNYWNVVVGESPTGNISFREFSKIIKVTNGCLYLTNYEDLTMAAQFADDKMPAKHHSDLRIELDNGHYIVTIKQMRNPDDYVTNDEEIGFEITFLKDNITESSINKIFWIEE